MPAPDTARDADPKRPQHQAHDAHHALAQHEAARDDDEPDPAVPVLAPDAAVVEVLDDAADEAREREGGRVQEADRECDAGRDPFCRGPPCACGVGLEGGDGPEEEREAGHEDAALFWELAVACGAGRRVWFTGCEFRQRTEARVRGEVRVLGLARRGGRWKG